MYVKYCTLNLINNFLIFNYMDMYVLIYNDHLCYLFVHDIQINNIRRNFMFLFL